MSKDAEQLEGAEQRKQRNAEFAKKVNELLAEYNANPVEIIVIACKLMNWHLALPNEKCCQENNDMVPGLIIGQAKYLTQMLNNSDTLEKHNVIKH